MKSAGDLCTLAMGSETTWEMVKCNVRHILARVLHGMEYLHSKFYQHCDLKGIILAIANCVIDTTTVHVKKRERERERERERWI